METSKILIVSFSKVIEGLIVPILSERCFKRTLCERKPHNIKYLNVVTLYYKIDENKAVTKPMYPCINSN